MSYHKKYEKNRKNQAERLIKRRGYNKIYRAKFKEAALVKLGNRCSNPACQWLNLDGTHGCTDARCLQVDHKFGGGHIERQQGILGKKVHTSVLEDNKGKYQLLCANCNWIKRAEKGETRGYLLRG